MPVIAALHDPLAILVADDLADVVPPDDDRTDRRSTGIGPIMGPGACKIVGWAGVAADLAAHIPAAPGSRPTCVVMASSMMVMTVVMVRPGLRA
jgi:hypothetical protein